MASLNGGAGLALRVAELEQDIIDLSGEQIMGLDELGAQQQSMSGSVKYASRQPVTATGLLTHLVIDIAGGGSTGSGSQNFRGQVHSDTSGEPVTLLQQTAEVNIPYATSRTQMRVPLASPISVTEGSYLHLGLHGGGTTGVARYGYTGVSGGQYKFITDTYTDGATATWGAGTTTTINGQTLAISAVIVSNDTLAPAVEALQSDVTALQAVDVTLDERLDAIEGGPSGEAPHLESNTPLGSGGTYQTSPIFDFASTGGALIVSTISNVAGTLYLEESTDGSSWVSSVPITAPANQRAHGYLVTLKRYARIRYVNGGTAQASFELVATRLA